MRGPIADEVAAARRLTGRPITVNLPLPFVRPGDPRAAAQADVVACARRPSAFGSWHDDPPMRKLIYSMGVSLDGYIAGPDGTFGWSAPDEELHRFHNAQAAGVGIELYGRRLYETMRPWQAWGDEPSVPEVEREFARIWQATPKVVFSTTLDAVEGNARLARDDPAEEIARLKAQDGKDIAVGGAGLAATFIRLDEVDEYRPLVFPVVVGGGTPFFPALEAPRELELVETRTFASRVVYLRYARVRR